MLLAQSFQLDILTIILIVVVVAFIVTGAIRGVLKMLLQFGSNILSSLFALFLAKPLGTLIYNIGIFNWFIQKTSAFLSSSSSFFNEIITSETKVSLITKGFETLKIPSRFSSIIINIGNVFIPDTKGLTIANYLSETFFIIVSIVLSGLILYGLLRLITFLLTLLIKKIDEVKVIKVINHLFGGLVGLCAGLFTCLIIMIFVTLLIMIPQLNEPISKAMFLDNDNVWTLSKWLYEQNILEIILKLLGLG